MFKPLLLAVQFLTRIPVPVQGEVRDIDSGRSLLFYPLVGLLIGSLLLGIDYLLADSPALLRAVVLVTVWVALSGGLHLDGLADMADAWIGGHGDRERTLAIMKDPASGPLGVLALLLLLLLKVATLEQLGGHGSLLLIVAPLLGRTLLVLLFLTTPYVRKGGLGDAMSKALPRSMAWFIVAAVVVGVVLLPLPGVARGMLLAVLTMFILFRRALMARLGGTTGDTAGALLELGEATVLLYSALVVGFPL